MCAAVRIASAVMLNCAPWPLSLAMLSQFAPATGKVLLDLLESERVVPGGNRRVRGEHGGAPHGLERVVERCAGLEVLADALQGHEGRVALVQVPDSGRDAERAKRAHPANSQDHFLLDPRFAVAAVQAGRELPIPRRVLGQVCIEQEQPHAPQAHTPHRGQHCAIAERHGSDAGPAFRRERRLDRRLGPRQPLVVLFLPAVVGHALVEVALRVHEPDAHQGDAEVTRFLAVIAGQHAETAGIDRQRPVQRELGREVGDRAAVQHVPVGAPPRVFQPALLVAPANGLVIGLQEPGIVGSLAEALLGDLLEHLHRVVQGAAPERVVETAEHVPGPGIPAPPEVEREVVQAVNP
jgi:hypothetical protein